MKPIYYICCVAIILIMAGIASADNIATVHGVAYEWNTFEPLDNAIIEVNSTPAQSMVAQYGVYSFELANGTYLITASYYEDDQLTYYAEDLITVSEEGSYVLDLLLVPSYSGTSDQNSTVSDVESISGSQSSSLLYGSIVVVLVLLAIITSQMKQRPLSSQYPTGRKEVSHSDFSLVPGQATYETSQMSEYKVPEAKFSPTVSDKKETAVSSPGPVIIEEPPVTSEKEVTMPKGAETLPEPASKNKPTSDEPVPADLQEILDILKSQGGRMTQKDMRKRLRYSEGKVSLMLLDLEKRGKIQKFKKGRGNVLFLVESEK